MKIALLVALALFALAFLVVWIRALRATPEQSTTKRWPSAGQLALGFGTDFFDTLGIGAFAPTAAVFRLTGMVPDERIPGTMNVGHTLPVVVMAFLFIDLVEVETTTLVTLLGAAVLGAWFGAGLVARLPRRPIQIGIGVALAIAALLFTLKQFDVAPSGGDALHLETGPLVFAALAVAILGALNTLGIGLYGPCMILVALLGMDPQAAFPIMMGSCAFLMPVGSARFVRQGAYSIRPALGLTLGGVPAVFCAVWLVESMDLTTLRWLVILVATYTAATMLWSAWRSAPSPRR